MLADPLSSDVLDRGHLRAGAERPLDHLVLCVGQLGLLYVRVEDQVLDSPLPEGALDVDQAERAVAAGSLGTLDRTLDQAELTALVSLRHRGADALEQLAAIGLRDQVGVVGQLGIGSLLGALGELAEVLGIAEGDQPAPATLPCFLIRQPAGLLEEPGPVVVEPLSELVSARGGRSLHAGRVGRALRLPLTPVTRVHLELPVLDQLEGPQIPLVEVDPLC